MTILRTEVKCNDDIADSKKKCKRTILRIEVIHRVGVHPFLMQNQRNPVMFC